jgi:hypothetical protein
MAFIAIFPIIFFLTGAGIIGALILNERELVEELETAEVDELPIAA